MSDKNVSKDVIFEESLPNWALIDEVSVTLLESGLARFPTLQALLPSIIAFDAKSLEATQRSQKLLRISQLQIEYLLKSQHQLLQRIAKLDDELRSRRKEVKQLKESITRDDASFFRVGSHIFIVVDLVLDCKHLVQYKGQLSDKATLIVIVKH
ncbi:hypothetical protein NECAME_07580 [Necator americanus]|uniref:Cilium assembly protein DZIP1 N-terminal domain-containing protein n=1 Tax=Necator americanus TaxID=51031 RepID=W2TLX0_NECAM|nr:hypothetical protein NECAME_07580 [Necator americanus]ETN83110.1 hypothetical protein NECAME_07580 [Necator americanus]